GREPAQGGPHEHGTGRSEERSAAYVGSLCVSVHDGVLRTRRLHALTSLVPRVEQAVPQTQESGVWMLAASERRHVIRARMPSATLAQEVLLYGLIRISDTIKSFIELCQAIKRSPKKAHIPSNSYETKTPLSRPGRKKAP